MNFTVTQMALAVLVFMTIIGVISYLLGKKKTLTPAKAAALGFVFSVIPVLGIIYVLYLATKEDVKLKTP